MSVQLQLGAATTKLEGVSTRVFAGRDPAACQLAHMDPTLSRRHAEVWVENGTVFLRDLGSANGTWVNGTHLGQEAVALTPGQQIYLGHVPLGVTWGIDGSKTAMATDMPPELKALIAARQQQQAAAAAAPLAVTTPASTSTPLSSTFAYRKQGANSNGVMLLALIRWSEGDVDASAVGLPSGDAGGVTLVGVGNAAVMLFFELVLFGVGRGIAAQPELFDELLARFIGVERVKRQPLFRRDEVEHVFIEPTLVNAFDAFGRLRTH